jgi:flagellar biosynthesis protein FlhB
LGELSWNGARAVVLGLTALVLAVQAARGLQALAWSSPARSAAVLMTLAREVALWLAGITLLLGLADLVLRVLRRRRALMTSRSESQREQREDYGLPEHRAARRRLAEQASEHASAEATTRANVLLLDERGRAIALSFDEHDHAQRAPRVVAKGEGAIAARMHAAAEAAAVPIALAPWLLAALHRLELGEHVPAEHHVELAERVLAERGA